MEKRREEQNKEAERAASTKALKGREQEKPAKLQITSCSSNITLQISIWKKQGRKRIVPSSEQREVHLNTILLIKNNEFKIDCIAVLEFE